MNAIQDEYAKAIIAEGFRRAISPRGIVIALATGLVETGLYMYANEKVADSFNYPHEKVGSDGLSVGVFQQQIRKGPTGLWWWADTATCMDIYKSAGLFYDRLIKMDYDDQRIRAGWFAQKVQQSAYPDRYDERIPEAQAIFDRLKGAVSMSTYDYGITKVMHGYNADSIGIGNSDGVRVRTPYGVVHTQQARSTAVNLANFCNNSATTPNPVSYNVAVDDVDTIEIVPLNEAPWAAAAANGIGFHLCFAGSFAEWDEGKWLSKDTSDGLDEDAMLTRGAKAMAAACQEFGIAVLYAGDDGNSGWPIEPSGICGHRDFGQRGGGHTDPGDGFPMGEFIRRVNAFIENKETDDMSFADDELQKKFPSRSAYRTTDQPIDTLAGLICNIDARIHEEAVEGAALSGDPEAIETLKRVAREGIMGDRTGFDYPGIIEATKAQAQRILDQIGK